jgi:hypothetical protein
MVNRSLNKTLGLLEYCKTSDYLNELMDMDVDKWNKYYKFSIVRNPMERFISGIKQMYEWQKKIDKTWVMPKIEDYIKFNGKDVLDTEYGHIFMTQTKHMSDENGQLFINGLIRTENLDNDFNAILRFFGFNIIHPPNLPKINKSNLPNILLSPNLCKRLEIMFKEDMRFVPIKNTVWKKEL